MEKGEETVVSIRLRETPEVGNKKKISITNRSREKGELKYYTRDRTGRTREKKRYVLFAGLEKGGGEKDQS